MSTSDLLLEGLTSALPEQRQLEFAHGALQSQQQPIVDVARIVHRLVIDQQRTGHGAQIEQVMPVPIVACQPRRFQRQHGADFATADRGQKLPEAGPVDQPATTASQVFVDDDHAGETELASAVGQGVLTLPTLVVGTKLLLGRLPDVDIRAQSEVGGSQFVDHMCVTPNDERGSRGYREWRFGRAERRRSAFD